MDATPHEETGPESRLDRLLRLRAMHEQTLMAGEVPVREFSALSREYRAVLADIDEIAPKEAEGDGIDEIAQRRGARRSGAAKGARVSKRSG